MFDIRGKVALVTGAASGIGFSISRQLLLNSAKGVVLADINLSEGKIALEKLSVEFGKESVTFICTDVSDKKSFEEAFKCTVAKFEGIDILVNNAGIFDDKNYEKEVAVNMTGIAHGIILGLQYIANSATHRNKPEGVIINTSSVTGTKVFASCPIYGATKSAIVSMTMAFGNDIHFKRTNVKVVAIAPGVTITPIQTSLSPIQFFHESCLDLAEKFKEIFIPQSAQFVAEHMIQIIREKPSGTVWIVENNRDAYEYIPSIPAQIFDI